MSFAQHIAEWHGGQWRGDHGAYSVEHAAGGTRTICNVIVRDVPGADDVHIECTGGDWKAEKDRLRYEGFLPGADVSTAIRCQIRHAFGDGAQLIEEGDFGGGLSEVLPPPLPIINPMQWAGIDPPARRWLVDGWLAAGSGAFLTGDGGVGKSLFTQQLCTCIAAGESFLGLEVEQTATLYLTCEDDAAELHRRQVAINSALGLSMADLAGRLHLVSLKGELGNELVSFDGAGQLQLAQRYRDLEATARQIGAGFVAIDNVAQTFNGNENIRIQVAAFCNLMDRLAMAIDGTVLFLGHPSKAGAEFSGSTGWEAHVRQRLFLDWADEGKGAAGDRDGRVLKRSKANYSRKGAEVDIRWQAGAFVLEGMAGAGALPSEEDERRHAREEAIFLDCLRVRLGQQRPVSESPNAANYAPKVFVAMPEHGRVTKEALAAAMERLIRCGRIERATPESPLWRGQDRKPVLGLREVAA
jgi:RecA-family ATPase